MVGSFRSDVGAVVGVVGAERDIAPCGEVGLEGAEPGQGMEEPDQLVRKAAGSTITR
jgi:hypothetical protein